MEDILAMKGPPSPGEIQEAAIELAVDPAFIEKDWYAVRALESIVSHSSKNHSATFSGGTSLSKGYGLIQRFSEDLDFVISNSQTLNRAERKAFRESVIQEFELSKEFKVDRDSLIVRDSSKFFSLNIYYPQQQDNHPSLRPHLKLEMSFRELSQAPAIQPIGTFVAALKKQKAQVSIPCVTPEETGADKLNALVWRVLIKDRGKELGSKWNEPQIMRHLHDLCAIKSQIIGAQDFARMALEKFPDDAKRGDLPACLTLKQAARDVIERIEADQFYMQEYAQFVAAMSYAPESEQIDFDRAFDALKNISAVF